jgi:hypothetical protein
VCDDRGLHHPGKYACGHHLLLAHGATKALYDARYRAAQVSPRDLFRCVLCVVFHCAHAHAHVHAHVHVFACEPALMIHACSIVRRALNDHTSKDIHKKTYTKSQGGQGKIGIALNIEWLEPLDASSATDRAAAATGVEGALGWFADPLFFGECVCVRVRVRVRVARGAWRVARVCCVCVCGGGVAFCLG